MQRPTTENKQKLVSLSKNVAATMTEIIQAAEAIKGWSPLSILNPLCWLVEEFVSSDTALALKSKPDLQMVRPRLLTS